jgi:hypothetical protein
MENRKDYRLGEKANKPVYKKYNSEMIVQRLTNFIKCF